jgi:CBS-domain-containing membrane protein
MNLDWRKLERNLRRRTDMHHMAEGAVAGLVAGFGAAIAIFAMEWFSRASHYPLFIIPFATSIVLVIGSPEAEPAQPRALIGGHVVATLVGLAMF